MSDDFRNDLMGAVRREWWLVLLVVVIATLATLFVTYGDAAAFTGSSTVNIQYTAVNRYRPLLYGDRMLELIQSQEFYAFLSDETGIPVEDLQQHMRVSAQGKFLDKLAIRYEAESEADAREGADKLAKAVIAYAHEVGSVETERQAAIIAVREDAIERTEALVEEVRESGDPYEEADLLNQLAALKSETINAKSVLEGIQGAYTYDGNPVVSGAASNLRLDALAAALLAGLVAGIGLAALREWWLRRRSTVSD